MNCQRFENIVDDLVREGLIEASVRHQALHHADSCSACANLLAAEQELTSTLQALALEMNSVVAPQRVESYLLSAFNQRQLSQSLPGKRRWNYWNVAAAAAVVLVALGVSIAAWNSRAPVSQQVSMTDTPAVVPAPEVGEPSPGTPGIVEPKDVAADAPRKIQTRLPSRSPRATSPETTTAVADTEVATDFLPISYINAASLQDGGSVVRVELSRSAIVSMGFAVNMDRYGERVKADVLMGADGLARAIRFVQ